MTGNFAPIQRTLPLTPCAHEGSIPEELADGQYVRNGGNPLTNENPERAAHWFDGDGMLSGVLFRRLGDKSIQPEFVNQYILTDAYLNANGNRNLRRPVLPSIASFVNPLASVLSVILVVLRTLTLVILSHLPGSRHAVKKLSVTNTAVLFHDGRALATCESGPPIRFSLPGLETVGWFNGRKAENEIDQENDSRSGYGGDGVLSFMKEWTTGHPRVDPVTKELISYHCTFLPPYVNYSIVPATQSFRDTAPLLEPPATFNVPVPGLTAPKMMHDFAVAARYTAIMDLPLYLDPTNIARLQPMIRYDALGRARFGVFPRYEPERIKWFETNACVIFHTANCWESPVVPLTKPSPALSLATGAESPSLNLVCCRLTSASLVYTAAALAAPVTKKALPHHLVEEEQCRLYYYNFDLSSGAIAQQWALSAISFEFPTLSESHAMREARYIYGCSIDEPSFSVALGSAAKINYLAKFDVLALIEKGKANPPQSIKGCVDTRTVPEILQTCDPHDPIRLFKLPRGKFAQEPRFVPRRNPESEDDGWLLTYVFDETQLDERGECTEDAKSELWIIDAREMTEVVAKVFLPQRVPYGLHGSWFTEEDIAAQREVGAFRRVMESADVSNLSGWKGAVAGLRDRVERLVG